MRVAIAIPCYNEAPTIGQVVREFRAARPDAEILVFDNASTDGSAAAAEAAGARVVREKRRGKGYVMQRVFETVDADACVVVDGDATYYAEDLPLLLEPIEADRADMVVGDRLSQASKRALTDLHRFGNRAILAIINGVFATHYRDVLSGYRVMNRTFLRSVPLITSGFETETELTLQALEKGMVVVEVPIRYRPRPEGSFSKLSPVADGYRILITIGTLLKNHRPLLFFTSLGAAVALATAGFAWYWVGRWPEAAGAPALWAAGSAGFLLSALLVMCGVLMSALTTSFREILTLQRRPAARNGSVARAGRETEGAAGEAGGVGDVVGEHERERGGEEAGAAR